MLLGLIAERHALGFFGVLIHDRLTGGKRGVLRQARSAAFSSAWYITQLLAFLSAEWHVVFSWLLVSTRAPLSSTLAGGYRMTSRGKKTRQVEL